jgi:hypothetical protein
VQAALSFEGVRTKRQTQFMSISEPETDHDLTL